MQLFTICPKIGGTKNEKNKMLICVILLVVFNLVFYCFSNWHINLLDERTEKICQEVERLEKVIEQKLTISKKKPLKSENLNSKNDDLVFEEEKIESVEKASLGEFKITAYCSCEKCCGVWAKNRPVDEDGNQIVYGASGAVLKAGESVAVDPRVIPYGTKIEIDGKEYVAKDCGGFSGRIVDVYFENHEEALKFGVKYTEVFVVH